jgi:hypothetical protein
VAGAAADQAAAGAAAVITSEKIFSFSNESAQYCQKTVTNQLAGRLFSGSA